MTAPISRRQFINGVAVSIGAAATTPWLAKPGMAASGNAAYPPALTGMRGSHPGSFEVMHRIGRDGEDAPQTDKISGKYDLVVVGAGLSGLAAARKYQRDHPQARILILDNHDDFGGHAKRNEFTVNGHFLIGYGGSQTLENPQEFESEVMDCLRDIGIDIDRFETAYDRGFYERLGMQTRMFAEQIGTEKDVHFPFTVASGGGRREKPTPAQIDALPLTAEDRAKLKELMLSPPDYLNDVSDKQEILEGTPYTDYLRDYCGLSETLISLFRQSTNGGFAVAPDLVPAGAAWLYSGLPGFAGLKLGIAGWFIDRPEDSEGEPETYIHHFPDGNASVARLLVRKMIPGCAPGNTMDDIVLARFDYDKLDLPENKVRLRLDSTMVNVRPGDEDNPAKVTYVHGGETYAVEARHCIMACYNMAIPYLIPEMEEAQAEALASNVKAPLVYTNVALTNWRAFHKLGASALYCPDGFHAELMLDFPVSMGGYEFSRNPDEPIVLHMEYCPALYGEDLDMVDRFRMGRYELLELTFEEIERRTREQLNRILGPYGFDAASDIAAITVNRWPHGYAGGQHHGVARQTIGNVAIANSDASGQAMAEAAILMAYRAVDELS
ncbi:hypothetical protein RA27_19325 [Ruegeria sp. ANG-R]|nr:hypothetical protein RA27_19325 [Ruegeria sp. ANG-R]